MYIKSNIFMKQIKFKLKEHFDNNEINLSSFENKAGLKRNAIHNILYDKSKNPTIENVVKIAEALDCSIDELLGRDEYFKKYIKNHRSEIEYNAKLFNEILETVNKYIESNKISNPSVGDVLHSIEEIYEYSISTTKSALDDKFALWFLKNQFKTL